MRPLDAIFGAAVDIRNRLYDQRHLLVHRLQGPVVSIGNISVGGTGKTPFLILLGELLHQRGVAFDVLSRGYRRQSKGVVLVDPQGSPEQYGDEPLLIARQLSVPVIVGEERYEAGRFAEWKFGPQLHLLDDGFQHRRLARDFDIVLLAPDDLRDRLMPAGRLREPLGSLIRADAVVFDDGADYTGVPLSHQCVWRIARSVVAPEVRGLCFAFCGIARPENFFGQLRGTGVPLAGTHAFRDHHRYAAGDIPQLLELRRTSGAAIFLTTEKDAVNLGDRIDELAPIHVVPVHMELRDADVAVDALLARIKRLKSQSA